MEKLLTVSEAARLLGIKTSTLYSWVSGSKKKINYVKLSARLLRFRESDLAEFVSARSVPATTFRSALRRHDITRYENKPKLDQTVNNLVRHAKRHAGLL